MDRSIVVAQANNAPGPNTNPPQVITVNKPQGEQSITLHLNGSTKLDLSAIANDNITLVHIGDRLIILFDNYSQVTIEPFYSANGQPAADLTVELGPGRDVTSADFAGLFPVTTDQSVLPAAGGPGAPSSGANFVTFTIDALATPGPLALLGPEGTGGAFGPTTEGPLNQQLVPMSLTGAVTGGGVLEGGLITETITDPEGLVLTGNSHGSAFSASGVAGALDALVNFGTGGPGGVPFQFVSQTAANAWLSGLGLDSHGAPIDTATIIGNTLTASTDAADGTPHDVFSLTINSNGSWVFTLLAPLDDAPGQGHNLAILDLSGLIQAVSAGGQTITLSGDFTIIVTDDTPILTGQTTSGSTDEGALVFSSTAPGDHFGNGNDHNQEGASTVFSGTLSGLVAFGADGPALATAPNGGGDEGEGQGTHLVLDGFQFAVANNSAVSLGITSHGAAVNFVTVTTADTPNGVIETLTAYTGGSTSGTEVFTLSLNGDGHYTFTLVNPLDDPAGGGENSATIDLSKLIQAIDFDGDSIALGSGDFQITVIDDVPVLVSGASASVGTVDEGALPNGNDLNGANATTVVSGSLASLVSFGADGPAFSGTTPNGFQFTAASGTHDFHVASHGVEVDFFQVTTSGSTETLIAYAGTSASGTEVFTLALNESTGAWTFTLLAPLDDAAGGGQNSATIDLSALVQAVDFDGDSVALSGDFQITVIDDVPVLVSGAATVTGTVDEGALTSTGSGGTDLYGNGNDHGTSATITASGSLASLVSFGADGPAFSGTHTDGFQFAAASGTHDFGVKSHGVEVDFFQVTTSGTTETLTAYAGTSASGPEVFTFVLNGDGSYTFTLINPLDDPKGGGENSATIDLSSLIQAVDFDGDSVTLSGDVKITVIDDIPVLVSGTTSGTVDEGALVEIQHFGTDLFGDGNDHGVSGAVTTVGGSLAGLVSFGADGAHTDKLFGQTFQDGFQFVSDTAAGKWLGSLGLTSHGDAIDSALIAPALFSPPGTVSETLTAFAGGHAVFTLTLNETTGAWTFQLLNPIDDPAGHQENSVNLDLSGLVQATDFDGDTVNLSVTGSATSGSTFNVTVIDDVPVLVSGHVTGTVDEGGLTSATDLYGSGNDHNAATSASGGFPFESGSLNNLVSFGADGPAISGSFLTTAANGFQFAVQSGATHEFGITSHGVDVNSITLSSAIDVLGVETQTLTASAGPNGPAVFTLTLDGDGSWVFHLLEPLDEQSGNGENTTTIDLSSLIKAVDFDGDSVLLSGDFQITVIDDVPVLVSGTTSGTVDEGALHQASLFGSGTDLYGDGNDHGVSGAVTTVGGSLANLVSFGADGPHTDKLLFGPTVQDGFQFVSGSAASSWLTSLDLSSHGEKIDAAVILPAFSPAGTASETLTAFAGIHAVFTLTLNETTGAWTFQLLNPIDDPVGNPQENSVNLDLSGLVQAVDFDGDVLAFSSGTPSSASNFNVTVIDDVPVLVSGQVVATVDEGGLTASTTLGDLYGNGNDHGAATSATGSLGSLVHFGADGAQSATVTGTVVDHNGFTHHVTDVISDGFQFVSGTAAGSWLGRLDLSSHGQEINSATVSTSVTTDGVNDTEIETLTASTSGTGPSDPGHEVFTLTLNVTTGAWTFQLINPIDDASGQGENSATIDLSGLVQAVDFDGDAISFSNGAPSSASDFTVTVTDDVPVTSGNLLVNGDFASGNFTSSPSYGGFAANGNVPGWDIEPSPVGSGTVVQLERVFDGYLGEFMPDGHQMVDLEASPGNIEITQTVTGLVAGGAYALEFFAGASNPASSEMKVFWDGTQIADIHPTGTETPYVFNVTGAAGNNTLTFEEVGPSGDNTGTYLADVSLEAGTPDGVVDEGALSLHTNGPGDLYGNGNDHSLAGATATATGSLAGLVSFGADGPAALDLTTTTKSTGGFQFISQATAQTAITGLDLTSHGQSVDVVGITFANGVATLTASTSGHEVFTLSLNEGTGQWTFTLVNPLDNPHPQQGAGEDTSILDLSGLVQAVDFDGDAVPLQLGSFLIDVIDDVPVLVSGAHTSGTVDEGGLDQVSQHGSGTDLYGDGNDPGAITKISGGLSGLVSFGADGAQSETASASVTANGTHVSPIAATISDGFQFVSGTAATAWLTSLGLSSHLQAINFAQITTSDVVSGTPGHQTVTETETLTAYTNGGPANGHEVFTLTLDVTAGAWTFQLINPIDHPASSTPENTVTIDLSGLVQAVDFDGDTVNLSVTGSGSASSDFHVTVIDDVPVLDRGSFAFGTTDEGALASTASGGTDLYGSGNDQGDGDHDFDDFATVTASGNLNGLVDFGADGPNANAFQFVSQTAATAWVTGLKLTSHGDKLDTASFSTDSHGNPVITVGTDQGDGHSVFTLTLDQGTGQWTFTLLNPIDDTPGQGENSANIDLSGLIQAVDFDGDAITLSGDFSIKVIDDVPGLTSVNASGTVDEGALTFSTSSAGDHYGSGNDVGGATASIGGTLSGLVAFGADGPSATPYSFVSQTAASFMLANLGITSHGQLIDNASISVQNGIATLIASSDGQSGHEVFTLSLNEATGAWTFTLINPIDHISGHGENVTTLDLSTLFQATDFDGDTIGLLNDVSVKIIDDVPVLVSGASASVGSVDEGGLSQTSQHGSGTDLFGSGNDHGSAITATGTLSGLVAFGADGPASGTVFFNNTIGEGYQFVSEHTAESWLAGLNGGQGLTSHGETIDQVEVSFNNGIATLTASTDFHDVFTLQLNETTGAWTFTLINPLDHPASSTPENGLTIDLSGLMQGVDFDGDAITLSGDVSVTVIDDIPVVSGTSSGAIDEGKLTSGSLGDQFGSGNDHGSSGSTSATGSLASLVSFGADGPQSATVTGTFSDRFGTHHVTDTIADGFQFVSGTAAGSWLGSLDLSSHGQTINSATITTSITANGNTDTETETLTASTSGTGGAGGHEVFTLTLDVTTGAWTFQLINPIDNGGGSATIDLSGLVQAVDFDGDAVSLSSDFHVIVTVIDDVPVLANGASGLIGTVNEGGLLNGNEHTSATAFTGTTGSLDGLVHFGADGQNPTPFQFVSNASSVLGNLGLDSHSAAVNFASVTTTAGVGTTLAAYTGGSTSGTEVFTLTLNDDGSWTFKLLAPIDHNGSETIDLSGLVQAVDFDGDTVALAAGDLKITITDDTPIQIATATLNVVVDEGGLTSTTTGGTDTHGTGNDSGQTAITTGLALTSLVSFGADGPGSIHLVGQSAAASWLSGLDLMSHGSKVDVAVLSNSNDTLTAQNEAGDKVFSLTVNPDGTWTFTLLEPLDHPFGDDTTHSLTLNLSGLLQATDFDGSTITLSQDFTIQVQDDVPVLVKPTPVAIIDGNFLGDGVHDFTLPGPWSAPLGATDNKGFIEGWSYGTSQVGGATPGNVELERVDSGYAGAISSNGAPMVDLEASPGNIEVSQTIAGLVAGENIQINFEIGEANFGNAKLAVLWNGTQIATYDPQNGPTQLESLVVTSTGTAGTIEFEEIGQSGDNTGTYLTNVSALQVAGVVDEGGLNVPEQLITPPNDETFAIAPIFGNDQGAATTASGSLSGLVAFGADGPAAGGGFSFVAQSSSDAATEIANLHLSSLGSEVTQATLVGNTLTAIAADGHDVFSLTLNGNGTWTFNLLAPLDDAHNGEDAITIDLSSLVQATDFDGDSVTLSGDFQVAVIDDVPVVTGAAPVGNVDEHNLLTDENPTGGAQVAFGTLNIEWGADDGAAKHLAFATDSQGHPIGPVDANGNALHLTAGGQALAYEIVQGPEGPGLIAYYQGSDPSVLTNQVFSLTLSTDIGQTDPVTGELNPSYTFALLHAFDEPGAGANTMTLNFNVTGFDSDGDSVQQTVTINVKDDIPEAPPTNLLVNGSFELGHPDTVDGQWSIYHSITGWTDGADNIPFEVQVGNISGVTPIFGDSIIELDSDTGPGDGSNPTDPQHINTTGHTNATIQQTVTDTIEGQTYEISFWYSPRPQVVDTNSSSMNVLWNGQVVDTIDSTSLAVGWNKITVDVTASGTSSTVGFQGSGLEDTWGALIDNVSLTAVGVVHEDTSPIVTNAPIGVLWGADGPGAIAFTDAVNAANDVTAVSGSGPLAGLTAGGQAVAYAFIGTTLVGYTGGTAPTSLTDGHIVFTLTLADTGSGAYTFDLKQPLDHPTPDVGGNHYIDLTFATTATDGDNDTVSAPFTVRIDAAGVITGDHTIDYSADAGGIFVNLSNESQTVDGQTVGAETATDRAGIADVLLGIDQLGTEIHNVIGTAGDDILVGGSGTDSLSGEGGNDTFIYNVSSHGQETVDGGSGTNTEIVVNDSGAAQTFNINPITLGGATDIGVHVEAGAHNVQATAGNYQVATNGVQELVIQLGNAGDTVAVNGDLSGTGLATSTITIQGGTGDDTVNLSGFLSNEDVVYDGGANTATGDTVIFGFASTAASYSAVTDSNGHLIGAEVTYTAADGGKVTDVIFDVEHFQFTDSTFSVGQLFPPTANDVSKSVVDTPAQDANTLVASGNAITDVSDSDIDQGTTLSITAAGFANNGETPVGADTVIAGTYGNLVISQDGGYTYTANAAFDGLTPGQNPSDVFHLTVADSDGGSSAATLTINIAGGADTPTTAPLALQIFDTAAADAGQQVASGNLLGLDGDRDIGVTLSATPETVATSYGTFSVQADGDYTFTASSGLDALPAGATELVSFQIPIGSSDGATTSQQVNLTFTGAADTPTVSAVSNAVLDTANQDAGNVVASGNVLTNDTDRDAGVNLSVSAVSFDGNSGPVAGAVGQDLAGTYGTLHLGSDGTYSYTANSNLDALTAGQQASDQFSFTVSSSDGASTATTLTFNVTGAADTPTTPLIPVTVTDTSAPDAGHILASGNIFTNDSDRDSGVTLTATAETLTTTFGTFAVQTDGDYTFTAAAGLDALAAGQTGSSVFNVLVQSSDGAATSQLVSFTYNGVDDTPINVVPGAQATTENTNLVFSAGNSNAITVSDVDSSSLTVTLTDTGGHLTLGSTSGLTSFTGNGTNDVVLTGSQTSIDAALSGLTYAPAANSTTADDVHVHTTDGTLTADSDIAITINPPPDTITANAVSILADTVKPRQGDAFGVTSAGPGVDQRITSRSRS